MYLSMAIILFMRRRLPTSSYSQPQSALRERNIQYRYWVSNGLALLVAGAWILTELSVYHGGSNKYGAVILQIVLALYLLILCCLHHRLFMATSITRQNQP